MKHTETLLTKIKNYFNDTFKAAPLIVKSPGRVNLIGEHTDYNNGFVLPAAVDKHILFGIAPNHTDTSRLYAVNMDQTFNFKVNDTNFEKSDLGWPNYLMGVVDQLKKAGYEIGDFDCAFGGNIPIGAGMSSSAALEGGLIFGLSQIFDLDIDALTMVKLAQKAENEFVGVQCGIMDQFINIYGNDNHVLKLDCLTLEFEYHPFDNDDYRIVLCDSKVRHDLATSEYNIRREQCEEGVHTLQKNQEEVNSLRDVTLDMLNKHQQKFDPVIFKRCEYVVEENDRVNAACNDLEKGDFKSFGKRMYASHEGLKNKYEVSCNELDILVDIAKNIDGVLGSRMMGAGFGGCTINLVEKDKVNEFIDTVKRLYTKKTGNDIEVYQTEIKNGVSTIYKNEMT